MCKEYINLQTGKLLDLERVSILPNNAMLKVRPDLWEQWDFKKNNELSFDIWALLKASNKKVWWYCGQCKSKYQAIINNRVSKESNCPYCAGKKANHTNSLLTLYPELASEWHPTKNGNLTPNDVTSGSKKKVWWLGKCGHEWEATVYNRLSGCQNCPYCASVKILKGFNDMWTTNPELASLLADPNDGYKYMQNSNKKLDWTCPDCKSDIKGKLITSINSYGLKCPRCYGGKSTSERIMFNLLSLIGEEFYSEKTFEWSDSRRYDFYVPSKSLIIEMHGEQHYKEASKWTTFEQQKQNDDYKKSLALNNGIINYLEINAEKSEFEYIFKNIMNSKLNKIYNLDDIDVSELMELSASNVNSRMVELWNEGFSTKEIGEMLKYHKGSVVSILREMSKSGICDFNHKKSAERYGKEKYKKVLQLDLEGNIVKEWNSLTEAVMDYQYTITGISSCCHGKQLTHRGYIWRLVDGMK